MKAFLFDCSVLKILQNVEVLTIEVIILPGFSILKNQIKMVKIDITCYCDYLNNLCTGYFGINTSLE
jgi:hypothetical protein